MSSSNLTRRALVASTAAIPAAAVLPLAAVQAATEFDPTFAVLERFRAATDAFNAFDGPEDGPQHAALENAFHEAADFALEIVPTTLAGMKAKISFFIDDEEMSGYFTDCDTNESLHGFLNTLYKSACVTARVP